MKKQDVIRTGGLVSLILGFFMLLGPIFEGKIELVCGSWVAFFCLVVLALVLFSASSSDDGEEDDDDGDGIPVAP